MDLSGQVLAFRRLRANYAQQSTCALGRRLPAKRWYPFLTPTCVPDFATNRLCVAANLF